MKVDDEFFNEIQKYTDDEIEVILSLLFSNSKTLPDTGDESETVCGVVHGETPLFFEVEYIKDPEEEPTYIDIFKVEINDYLDAINNKTILRPNEGQGKEINVSSEQGI
jgi:hypothetical protein